MDGKSWKSFNPEIFIFPGVASILPPLQAESHEWGKYNRD